MRAQISGTSVVVRRSDVAIVHRNEGVIIVDLASASPRPLALNSTAADVWSSISSSSIVADHVIEKLAGEHGVSSSSIRADVLDVIGRFVEIGYVNVRQEPRE